MDPKDKKEENSKLLYDALAKDYDLGSYEEFLTDVADPKKAKLLYDEISKEYELGDFKTFYTDLGVGSQMGPEAPPDLAELVGGTSKKKSEPVSTAPLDLAGPPTTVDELGPPSSTGSGTYSPRAAAPTVNGNLSPDQIERERRFREREVEFGNKQFVDQQGQLGPADGSPRVGMGPLATDQQIGRETFLKDQQTGKTKEQRDKDAEFLQSYFAASKEDPTLDLNRTFEKFNQERGLGDDLARRQDKAAQEFEADGNSREAFNLSREAYGVKSTMLKNRVDQIQSWPEKKAVLDSAAQLQGGIQQLDDIAEAGSYWDEEGKKRVELTKEMYTKLGAERERLALEFAQMGTTPDGKEAIDLLGQINSLDTDEEKIKNDFGQFIEQDKEAIKQQDEVDAKFARGTPYGGMQEMVARNVIMPVGRVVTDFVATVGKGATDFIATGGLTNPNLKNAKQYKWYDKVKDDIDKAKQSVDETIFPQPRAFEAPAFEFEGGGVKVFDEKGKFNPEVDLPSRVSVNNTSVIPQTSKMFAQTAALLLPAAAAGKASTAMGVTGELLGAETGYALGLMASSYVNSYYKIFDEALNAPIEQRMSRENAAYHARTGAAIEGVLELVSPQRFLTGGGGMTATKALKRMTKGAGNRVVEGTKFFGKELAAEESQEIFQTLGGYANQDLTNRILGKKYFEIDANKIATELGQVIPLTAIMVGGTAGPAAMSNPLYAEAVHMAADDPAMLDRLRKEFKANKTPQDVVDKVLRDIGSVVKYDEGAVGYVDRNHNLPVTKAQALEMIANGNLSDLIVYNDPEVEKLLVEKATEIRKQQEKEAPVVAAQGEQGKIVATETQEGRPVAAVAPAEEEAPERRPRVITPQIVHAAAQDAGINYDTDEFKAMSKEITGKEHLDDMTEPELRQVFDKIKPPKAKAPVATTTKQGATVVTTHDNLSPEKKKEEQKGPTPEEKQYTVDQLIADNHVTVLTVDQAEVMKAHKNPQTARMGRVIGGILTSMEKIAPGMRMVMLNSNDEVRDVALKLGLITPKEAKDGTKFHGFYYDGDTKTAFFTPDPNKALHEAVMHPVLDVIEQEHPEIYKQFTDEVATILKGFTENGDEIHYLSDAKKHYTGEETQKKEAVVNFLSDVGAGKFTDGKVLAKIRELLHKLLVAVGISPADLQININDNTTLRDFASQLGDAIRKGQKIEIVPHPKKAVTSHHETTQNKKSGEQQPVQRQAAPDKEAAPGASRPARKGKAGKGKAKVKFSREEVALRQEPAIPHSAPATLAILSDQAFKKMEHQMVAPQAVRDLIKGRGKQIEKDIINQVLDQDKFKAKRIPFDEVVADIGIQTMRLERVYSDSYANYGRDNLGDNQSYGDAETIIFNAPIEHGETGHFSSAFKAGSLGDREWEIKQLGATDTWAAVDKSMPADVTAADVEKYVGTAGKKGDVERWVQNRSDEANDINVGLFGHIRAWHDEHEPFYLAELQSDYFQKHKASEMLASQIPADEIETYMYKHFRGALENETVEKYKQAFGLKVSETTTEDETTVRVHDADGDEITRWIVNPDKAVNGRPVGEYERHQAVITAAKKLADAGKWRYAYSYSEERESPHVSNRYNDSDETGYKEFATKDEREEFLLEQEKQTALRAEKYADIKDEYYNKNRAFEVKKNQYIQQRIDERQKEIGEDLTMKQFIASQKNHEMRLFREAIKYAADKGAEVLRFPAPYTVAVIEGYVDKSGEGSMPYEVIRGGDGRSGRLDQGDTIDYGGTTYTVVDTNRDSITVAPEDKVNSFYVPDYITEEINNRVSEIEYEARKRFENMDQITKEEVKDYDPDEWMGDKAKELLEEYFEENPEEDVVAWKDIERQLDEKVGDYYNSISASELLDGYGDVYISDNGDYAYIVEGRNVTENFNQPEEYENNDTTEEGFENDLSDDQKTVVNKYEELGEAMKKYRPDTKSIRDENQMEWLETAITEADKKPVVAFSKTAPAEISLKEAETIAKKTEAKVVAGKTIPSMVITGKKNKEDVEKYNGQPSLKAIRQHTPAKYVSQADNYTKGFTKGGGAESYLIPKAKQRPMPRNPARQLEWADEVYKMAKATIVSNLLYIHDSIPEKVRDLSKLWYDGANIIANEMAKKYNNSLEQAAATIATQSPQKPWFDNVHVAHFISDFHDKNQDTPLTSEMVDYFHEKAKPTKANPTGYTAQLAYEPVLREKIGTKYSDLTDYDRAAMIRYTFDNFYERRAPKRLPTGSIIEGERESGMSSLSGYDTIGAAVSVLDDGSMENISLNLGKAFKIKNFFNNIAAPNTESEVTIDTHAQAAGHMLPLASTSPQVDFGNLNYALFNEAYREAGAKRGILGREMQSITWEGVKSLFPAEDKAGAEGKAMIASMAIWKDFKNGKSTIRQAQNKIKANGKDLSKTGWSEFSDQLHAEGGDGNYIDELPLNVRSNAPAEQGVRSDTDRSVPRMGTTDRGADRGRVKPEAQFSREENLAPNGAPSNLNTRQYEQVRTLEFKNWFGDWENNPEQSSKILDENGEPKVMYHGTSKDRDFDRFNINRNGSWYTDDPKSASGYATTNDSQKFGDYDFKTRTYPQINTSPRVIPVFLNVRRPVDFNKALTPEQRQRMSSSAQYKKYQQMWFTNIRSKDWMDPNKRVDGVYFTEDRSVVVVLDDSTQVKSAIANTGVYSPTNPKIQFSKSATEIIPKGPDGECYGNCFNYVLANDELLDNGFILHGRVTNASGNTINHAWIEQGDEVIDPTTGIKTDKARYYDLLNPEVQAKYTGMEAVSMSMKTRNHGPWTQEEQQKYLGKSRAAQFSKEEEPKEPTRTTKRVVIPEDTSFPPIREDYLKNPVSERYVKERQSISEQFHRYEGMTDQQIVDNMEASNIGELERLFEHTNGNDNFGILATIAQLRRAQKNGDQTEMIRSYGLLSRVGSSLGQLMRQMRELKAVSNDRNFIKDLLLTKFTEQGIYVSPEMHIALDGFIGNYVTLHEKEELARQTMSADPTAANVEAHEDLVKATNKKFYDLMGYVNTTMPNGLGNTIMTIIKGNLLTVGSVAINTIGNIENAINHGIVEGPAASIMGAVSRKIAGKDANFRGSTAAIATAKAMKVWLKTWGPAIKEAFTKGAMRPRDLTKFEIDRELHPARAFYQAFIKPSELPKKLRNKNGHVVPTTSKSAWAEKALEGTFGWPAALFYRLLFITDKPFTEAGKTYSSFLEFKSQYPNASAAAFEAFMGSMDLETKKRITKYAEKFTYNDKEGTLAKLGQRGVGVLDWMADWMEKDFRKGEGTGGNSGMTIIPAMLRAIKTAVFPYVTVPSNVIQHLIELTLPPVALYSAYRHHARGNHHIAGMLTGRAALGTMLYMTAGVLAQAGLLIDSDDEPREGNDRSLKHTVARPNAINLSGLTRLLSGDPNTTWKAGDKSVDMAKLGIFGMYLGTYANFSHAMGEKGMEEHSQHLLDALAQATGSTLKIGLQMPFMKGSFELLETLAGADKEGATGVSAFSAKTVETLSNLVWPNQLSQIYQATANEELTRASDKTFLGTVQEKMAKRGFYFGALDEGGLSPILDIWGQPIPLKPGDILHPLKLEVATDDEAIQVWNLTEKMKADNPITMPTGSIQLSEEDFPDIEYPINVRLEEVDYLELQAYAGRMKKAYIRNLFNESYYKEGTDQEKWAMIHEVNTEANGDGRDLFLDLFWEQVENGEIEFNFKAGSYKRIKPRNYDRQLDETLIPEQELR